MSIKIPKFILLILIGLYLHSLPFTCLSQNYEVLTDMNEFYKGCGVIFLDSSKVKIGKIKNANFYKPSIEDVRKSEAIFKENYQDFLLSTFREIKENYSLSSKELKKWNKTISSVDVKKQFNNYNRQYAGFINKAGERLIIINLLNYSNTKKAKKYFGDLKEEMIVGFGDFYEKNTKLIYVNIDQEKLIR